LAFIPVNKNDAIKQRIGCIGANRDARSTGRATIFLKEQLRLFVLRLRILAPETGQRTALQEYGSSYSGTVVYRVSLYVKDDPTAFRFIIRHRATSDDACLGWISDRKQS
jgi:hypothetical protein